MPVGVELLGEAASLFLRHRDRGLSFTDASHLVVMRFYGIDRLATFDGGFLGLADLVPEDMERRRP